MVAQIERLRLALMHACLYVLGGFLVVAPSQSAALSRGTLQMAWTNDLAEAWRVSTNRLEEVFSEHDEQARVSLLDEYVQEVLSLGMNCHRSLGPAYHLRLNMLMNAVNAVKESDVEVVFRWKCLLRYLSLLEKEQREFNLDAESDAGTQIHILPPDRLDMDTVTADMRQRNIDRFRKRSERLKRLHYAEFLVREIERIEKTYFSDGHFGKNYRELPSARKKELLKEVQALSNASLRDKLMRQTPEKGAR